jgi:hypothetical protein
MLFPASTITTTTTAATTTTVINKETDYHLTSGPATFISTEVITKEIFFREDLPAP